MKVLTGVALTASALDFSYGGKKVLNSLSFQATAGTILGLVGPNGAGKTTTMDLLTGLRRPSSGRVEFDGTDVTGVPAFRRASLGLVRTYQQVAALRRMSVLENVLVGALYGRQPAETLRDARRRAMVCLDRVNLTSKSDVLATEVSTGQQKLMDLARAMAMEPRVLLMDEPLAALSSTNRDLVMDVVREMREQGKTIVLIEHVMQAVLDAADEIVVVTEGSVLAQGSPSEISNSRAVIQAYLGPGFSDVNEGEGS